MGQIAYFDVGFGRLLKEYRISFSGYVMYETRGKPLTASFSLFNCSSRVGQLSQLMILGRVANSSYKDIIIPEL